RPPGSRSEGKLTYRGYGSIDAADPYRSKRLSDRPHHSVAVHWPGGRGCDMFPRHQSDRCRARHSSSRCALREAIAMERKLAAILAADVVGYSALMETDEAGTFDRVRAGRTELFEPEVQKHHGRIFKLMGDGLLAEFGSVVDAVECAVSLQHGMAERNAGRAAGKRIDVRIGVNLGDVIIEGDDRHGDGVNIAARLQQLAEPGGI